MAQLKKADLIKILVEDYGYEKEDLKLLTNAKLKGLIKQEEEDAKELELNENRVLVKDSTGLKDEDKVKVMSGDMGTVVYRSDISRKVWKFTGFGQIQSIPYGELVTMKNRFPLYFDRGLIIVLDKAVQDEFGLTEMYKNILTPQNIDGLFEMNVDELEAFIDGLPESMKNTFVQKAKQLYETGKLYDIRIVRLVENKFGFSLEDNAPLKDLALEGKTNGDVIYIDKR
ncbi:hypothetical protein PQE75_gp230 [Bacillus phage vB_BcoS-136]|uniref:Uncharacterized protein n=1 Tax=Bacillus phage vB_BcoS-136 TaxID=2419619 RepID=A0A3G3BVG5_9CAUD|nr:hypothetical protein PQE75_gp230 [Bacillus phage vB_BcoS-136]AYP68249.1 hypothetical protein vBBcoS136_00134 [Bacillus phage vB_BcoS-136]